MEETSEGEEEVCVCVFLKKAFQSGDELSGPVAWILTHTAPDTC